MSDGARCHYCRKVPCECTEGPMPPSSEMGSLETYRYQMKELKRQLEERDARFNEHTQHVSEFLRDIYAIAVDPLDDSNMKVAEMCAAIKQAVLRDREVGYNRPTADLSPQIAALTEALKVRDALLADIHQLALHAGLAAQIDWLAARKESK